MQRPLSAWPWMALALLLPLTLTSCGDEDPDFTEEAAPVLAQYATNFHSVYSDSLTTAQALQTAIDAFVAQPSAANLAAAKQAWLDAREVYGQTEVARFYGGPIDDDDGPEGQLNAWPLDEAYIDYVVGAPNSGIINRPGDYPELSSDVLAGLNEDGGEANISTGYHAIEFLLWGQDLSANGPGQRSHTDYLTGGGAPNPARRGQYLAAVAALLVSDLEGLQAEWAANQNNYRSSWQSLEGREGIRRMLVGMGSLSGAELAGERMTVAYDTQEQEDEHSCFSDNTHRDIYLNALGIQNVYLGRYGSNDGPGIDQLVQARDSALDARFKQELQASLDAILAIPTPFDQAIQGAGRPQVLAAIEALEQQTQTLVEIATLLDITLNLE